MCCGDCPSLREEPCGPSRQSGPVKVSPQFIHVCMYVLRSIHTRHTDRQDTTHPHIHTHTHSHTHGKSAAAGSTSRCMQDHASHAEHTPVTPGSGPSCRVSLRLRPTTDCRHLVTWLLYPYSTYRWSPSGSVPLRECVCSIVSPFEMSHSAHTTITITMSPATHS